MAAAASVAQLIVSLRLDDKGFTGKLNSAAASLNAMDKGLGQMGRGAGQVASGIGKIGAVAGAVAVGGLAAVVTTAASFEQAWAGVRKTVEGTEPELAALEDKFKQLSRTIPLSFEELAAIGAEGGALGIATEDLLDFTDIVARLAVSTNLSADQASTALGQLANVLGMESAEMRDFADSLVALGNDGASTESQIIDMTARFGAAGKMAGLSNAEILALASTTASMGVEAEAGGGALSRLFNNMTLDIGTATKESKLLADTMGLSLGELKTSWDRDAGGVFEDLLGHINELDQFEAAEFLKGLGITNTRDINAILLLSEGVGEYRDQLATAEGQTNELNRESDAFFNTTAGKWETLKNNVRLAADTIGGELLPVVNEVMDDMVKWLSLPQNQKGLVNFAKDLAGGVKDLVTEIKNADFGPLIESMKGAMAIGKAGFDAFNTLPPGVKAVALAALGVNKLTGGALTDVAKGFGNLFAGGLKLALPMFNRGTTPLNPMYVKDVGLLPGGRGPNVVPTPGGGGGGILGGVWKLIPALAAAEIARQVAPTVQEAADDLHKSLGLDQDWNPFRGMGPDDWQWPLGTQNPPNWLPDWLGGPPPGPAPVPPPTPTAQATQRGGSGTSEWARELNDVGKESGTSSWGKALTTKVDELPDTAMFQAEVGSVRDAITPVPPILNRQAQDARSFDAAMISTANLQASRLSETSTKIGDGNSINSSQLRTQADALAAARGGNSTLSQIRDKKNSVNVRVENNVNVGVSEIQYRIQSLTQTIGGSSSDFSPV